MTGGFAWHELMVPDPEAAAAFYGAVLGWGRRDALIDPIKLRQALALGRHCVEHRIAIQIPQFH